jgi:hypothetical protein
VHSLVWSGHGILTCSHKLLEELLTLLSVSHVALLKVFFSPNPISCHDFNQCVLLLIEAVWINSIKHMQVTN